MSPTKQCGGLEVRGSLCRRTLQWTFAADSAEVSRAVVQIVACLLAGSLRTFERTRFGGIAPLAALILTSNSTIGS